MTATAEPIAPSLSLLAQARLDAGLPADIGNTDAEQIAALLWPDSHSD